MSDMPQASHALLFHSSQRGVQRNNQLMLVTAHEVLHDRNGNPHIGPGRVALPSDEKMLADLLNSRSRRDRVQIMPSNILYSDEGAIAWWIPPEHREMLLRDSQGNDHAIDVQWPSLVALVVNRRLYVAACATSTRPEADTPLFHAPMGNIFSGTNVCTGSARLPSGQSVNDVYGWTGVMTRTWFTHDNHPHVIANAKRPSRKAQSNNYRACEFWLKRGPDAPPPTDKDMEPLGITLTSWIEGVLDAGDRP